MSQQAQDALRRELQAIYDAMRLCAWCDKRCESADHLYVHIVLRHPDR